MIEFVERLDESVDSLDERFDRIIEALEEYKLLEAPGLEAEAGPLVTDLEKRGESLFDNLLRKAIAGYDLSFRSGSEDEDSFAIIIDNTMDPVLLLDNTGSVLRTNPAFEKLFGFDSQDLEGQAILEFVPVPYHHAVRDKFAKVLSARRHRTSPDDNLVVFRSKRKNGGYVSVECLVASYLRDGEIEIAVILRDLANSHEIAAQLSDSEEQFETLSETITEAILRIDEDYRIIFANSAVLSTFGYTRQELLGSSFRELFPPEIFSRHEPDFRKYFYVDDQHRRGLGMKRTLELLGRHKHRGVSPMEMSFGNSSNYRGRSLTCIIRDISTRKNTERRLRHLAYHDKLTGLGNRDLFATEINRIFEELLPVEGFCGALLFLDLDGFKQVNDSLGHEAGDELLVETARRLRETLRETDPIFRFGGDEFVVLLSSIPDPRGAALVARKILEAVSRTFTLSVETDAPEMSSISVGVSIGIAMIPDHGTSLNRLTKSADLAMYHAKDAGKNCYRFFEEGMDEKVSLRLKMEQGLKTSLNAGGFELYFQPLVDPAGKIRGVEALVRWQDMDMGWVSPTTFIALAEETNLIIPLGNWIMETACRQISAWRAAGYDDLFVSINLSMNQFSHPDIVPNLRNTLRRSGASPDSICIEITETSVMKDPESTIAKIRQIKDENPGIRFVIDDFGTGYSSLNYLSRLPAEILKIDISFVSRLFEEQNQKVVNAIINLARNMEMEYVVEGVENEDQRRYFADRGCTLMQGFHFYRPMEAAKIDEILREENGGSREG
jgi:diguanylate cyclase (GGDEF)-like protein/PAS domain S-box-containing protein